MTQVITTKKPTSKKSPVVLSYFKGVREQIRRVFKQYDVLPAYFKPMNTLRQLLVRLKDKILKEHLVGPLWHIPCDSCDVPYTGKTERSSKARFLEHRRPSSTTSEVSPHIHTDKPEQKVDINGVKILAVEPRWFERDSLNEVLRGDPHQHGATFPEQMWGCYNLPSIRGLTTNLDPSLPIPNAILSFARVNKSPVGDESSLVIFRNFFFRDNKCKSKIILIPKIDLTSYVITKFAKCRPIRSILIT